MIKRLAIILLVLSFWGVPTESVGTPPTVFSQESLPQEQSWQDAWDKKHADQPAVELFYSSETEINKDGSYVEKIRRINKIQNENGMYLGEIPIFYDSKYEKIKNIKAYITTPDGKRHRYKKIQDIDVSSEAYYFDIKKKVITMPNVVVGSVIDWQYELYNSRGPIKGEFFAELGLYDFEPLKEEIFSYTVPENKKPYIKNINTDRQPEIIRKNGKVTYLWRYENDDGYDEHLNREGGTPPYIDFLPHVVISTMKEWSQLASWAWDAFSKNIILSPQIKAKVAELSEGKDSLNDKIAAIIKYMHDDFRYVAMNVGGHSLEPHPADEVFANKFGDCKDQSILLITMLKELGIEAYPVLVRDRDEGDVSKLLPSPRYFNHMIVAINLDDKLYFVDPLIEGYRINETPFDLRSDYCFVIDNKGGRFIQLPAFDLALNTESYDGNIYLREDGSALLELKATLNRESSIAQRKSIKLATEESRKDFLEYLENNFAKGGKLIDYSVEGVDEEYQPLILKVKVDNPNFLKVFGHIMIFGFDSSGLSDIFYIKERKFPLEFLDEWEKISIWEYIIPEGFAFEYIPKNIKLSDDSLDISVSYSRKGPNIKKEKRMHYKSAFIPPEKYQEFKDFLRNVDKELEECVIIRKAR